MGDQQDELLRKLRADMAAMVSTAMAPIAQMLINQAAGPPAQVVQPGTSTQSPNIEMDHEVTVEERREEPPVPLLEQLVDSEQSSDDDDDDEVMVNPHQQDHDYGARANPGADPSPDAMLRQMQQGSSVAETGPVLDASVAEACSTITKLGLPEESLNDILNKYLPPENCTILSPVAVNSSVWSVLQPHTRSADVKLQRPQKLTAKALVALARAMHEVKAAAIEKPSLNSAFSAMVDCFGILATNNREMNLRRRELMKQDFSPEYKALCKSTTPITQQLFGDSLEDEIKSHSETGKLRQQMANKQGSVHKGKVTKANHRQHNNHSNGHSSNNSNNNTSYSNDSYNGSSGSNNNNYKGNGSNNNSYKYKKSKNFQKGQSQSRGRGQSNNRG